MLLAGYGVFAASAWPWKAALFPLAIGIPMFCLAATELLWALLGVPEKSAELAELELTTGGGAGRRILVAAGWIFGLLAAIVLLGFSISVPLFVFLYLKLQGKESWILSVVLAAVAWVFFYGLFDQLLHLPFPQGWLLALLAS